ncbi:MAG: hypothetical protein AAFP88_01880 [Bacteroidota bacterium]
MSSYNLSCLRIFVLTAALLTISVPQTAAKSSTHTTLKITLEEAVILKTLLEQIDLVTEEVGAFLAVQNPLDALIALQDEEARADRSLSLQLPAGSAHDLLVFMNRMSLRAGGAKQVHGIMKKVEKLLPKDSPLRDKSPTAPRKVPFALTPEEGRLLQQMLLRIQVTSPELTAFLAIYEPLERLVAKGQEGGELVLKLSEQGPRNLLVFMQRFEMMGSQAKTVQQITERLEQLR